MKKKLLSKWPHKLWADINQIIDNQTTIQFNKKKIVMKITQFFPLSDLVNLRILNGILGRFKEICLCGECDSLLGGMSKVFWIKVDEERLKGT